MNASVSPKARVFLLFCAVGLVPIALSYGVMPSVSMDFLYGIAVDSTNLAHIFRAVMGLYLGMALIWVLGAFNPALTRPALFCCAVFMLGLAFGRGLSFALDGLAHCLMSVYALLDITLGFLAVALLREQRQEDK